MDGLGAPSTSDGFQLQKHRSLVGIQGRVSSVPDRPPISTTHQKIRVGAAPESEPPLRTWWINGGGQYEP